MVSVAPLTVREETAGGFGAAKAYAQLVVPLAAKYSSVRFVKPPRPAFAAGSHQRPVEARCSEMSTAATPGAASAAGPAGAGGGAAGPREARGGARWALVRGLPVVGGAVGEAGAAGDCGGAVGAV